MIGRTPAKGQVTRAWHGGHGIDEGIWIMAVYFLLETLSSLCSLPSMKVKVSACPSRVRLEARHLRGRLPWVSLLPASAWLQMPGPLNSWSFSSRSLEVKERETTDP